MRQRSKTRNYKINRLMNGICVLWNSRWVILKPKYIQKRTEIVLFCLFSLLSRSLNGVVKLMGQTRVSPIKILVLPITTSCIKYYAANLGKDSFELPVPVWYVLCSFDYIKINSDWTEISSFFHIGFLSIGKHQLVILRRLHF